MAKVRACEETFEMLNVGVVDLLLVDFMVQ